MNLYEKMASRYRRKIIPLFLVALFLFLAYGPLLTLFFSAINAESGNTGQSPAPFQVSPRQVELLVSSGGYALAVAVTCAFLGLLAALFLWQRKGIIWKGVTWILVLCIPFSGTIYSLAWMSFFQTVQAFVPVFPSLLSAGWLGSWFIQCMVYLPLSTILCLVGLLLMETDLIRAGKIFQKDIAVFSSIMVPLLMGVLVTTAFIAGIFSLAEYTIPSLFSLNVYSLEIFAHYSATYRISETFLLSLPLIFLIVITVLISQYFLRSALQNITVPEMSSPLCFSWPVWFRSLQYIGAFIICINIGVICYGLVSVLTTADLLTAWSVAAYDILYTLGVGLGAAAIAITLGLGVAWFMNEEGSFQWLFWALILIPLALPAPVIGLGVIHFWTGPVIFPADLGFLLPVMVAVIRFTPLAALILLGYIRLVHPSLFESGTVFSVSRWHAWVAINLPLLMPGILAGAAVVLAFTMGELGATLLVVPPGMSTLTIRLFNYLHYGASGYVASLAGAFVGLFVISGFFLYLVLRSLAHTAINW